MDIQARMRLKVSADKLELRQSYIPALFPYLIKPLMVSGVVSQSVFTRRHDTQFHLQSAVDDVIDRMDDYFLNREDWDTLIELGLDEYQDQLVLKKISTATKSAFTKRCVRFAQS